MSIFMYQATYTSESWGKQILNPQNRIESVARQVCEAVGGELIGAWLCFGDYDLVIVADAPNNESMAAVALAVGAGGAIKASKTTVLMTGAEGVVALEKAHIVAEAYRPAK
ncbi:MAG: GYD domain-containing protein [Alphaproteobacteria bacterium]